MHIPVHDLYTIIAETPAGHARVQQAMDWLLSPAAEGIGEKLLRDAYARTGKPVKLAAHSNNIAHYMNADGEHTVYLPLEHTFNMVFKDKNGVPFQLGYEQLIGHELVHAGQDFADPEFYNQVNNTMVALHDKLTKQAVQSQSKEAMRTGRQHYIKAVNTPYYFMAMHHIKPLIPLNCSIAEKTEELLNNHPQHLENIEKYEKPALAVERRIGELLGLPNRHVYTDASISHEGRQALEERTLKEHCGVKAKLGIPPLAHTTPNDETFWQNAIRNPASIKLEKPAHPLIGVHMSGDVTR